MTSSLHATVSKPPEVCSHNDPAAVVLTRLERVRSSGAGWSARCPAHEDRKPSLSVCTGDDGRVLLRCHAGCQTEAIVDALGLQMADLFPERESVDYRPALVSAPTPPTTYNYTDDHGTVLYRVVRGSGKRFSQQAADGRGGWRKGPGCMHGVRRVIYRLPEVLAAIADDQTVYVVEGEKDADRLASLGYTATCNPGGAGKWCDDYSQFLEGAQVVVVADRDEMGYRHARDVAKSLDGVAASVQVVQPAVDVRHADMSDHLNAGHSLEALQPVREECPVTAEGPFVDWDNFWMRDRREAEWIYSDVLARGRGHALYASRKAGKSLLMLWIAVQTATSPDPVTVVYFDYEMGEDDLYERLDEMGYGPDSDLSRLRYALLPTLPPLDTAAGAKAITELLDRVAAERPDDHLVVIFDTTARAVSGEENSADTFRAFYAHTGIELKRRGVTWARLDHAGKDPGRGQRGSSSKGDDVDVVWKLTRTENGVQLRRDLARMSWVPEKVAFAIHEHPLRFVPVSGDWPAGTQEVAELFDELEVPLNASTRDATTALKRAGEGRRRQVIVAALKWRRDRPAEVGNHPRTHLPDPGPEPRPEPPAETAQPRGGTTPGTTGNHPSRSHGNHGSLPRGNRVPGTPASAQDATWTTAEDMQPCVVCERPAFMRLDGQPHHMDCAGATT